MFLFAQLHAARVWEIRIFNFPERVLFPLTILLQAVFRSIKQTATHTNIFQSVKERDKPIIQSKSLLLQHVKKSSLRGKIKLYLHYIVLSYAGCPKKGDLFQILKTFVLQLNWHFKTPLLFRDTLYFKIFLLGTCIWCWNHELLYIIKCNFATCAPAKYQISVIEFWSGHVSPIINCNCNNQTSSADAETELNSG